MELGQAGAVTSPTRSHTAEWQVRVPLLPRDNGQAEPQHGDDHPARHSNKDNVRPGQETQSGAGSGSELRKYESGCRCSTARGRQ